MHSRPRGAHLCDNQEEDKEIGYNSDCVCTDRDDDICTNIPVRVWPGRDPETDGKVELTLFLLLSHVSSTALT
jgi:hypothetical protein